MPTAVQTYYATLSRVRGYAKVGAEITITQDAQLQSTVINQRGLWLYYIVYNPAYPPFTEKYDQTETHLDRSAVQQRHSTDGLRVSRAYSRRTIKGGPRGAFCSSSVPTLTCLSSLTAPNQKTMCDSVVFCAMGSTMALPLPVPHTGATESRLCSLFKSYIYFYNAGGKILHMSYHSASSLCVRSSSEDIGTYRRLAVGPSLQPLPQSARRRIAMPGSGSRCTAALWVQRRGSSCLPAFSDLVLLPLFASRPDLTKPLLFRCIALIGLCLNHIGHLGPVPLPARS